MPDVLHEFFVDVQQALGDGTLIALTLSHRERSSSARSSPEQPPDKEIPPRKQSVRPVQLRGQLMFQWELQFDKQQTHLNLNAAQTLQRLRDQLGSCYRNANLWTSTADVMVQGTGRGFRIRRQPPSRKLPDVFFTHNKQKEYLIPEGIPCPFLVELDVMTFRGQVKQQRQKKFRQINRYLEMVQDIYDALPATGTLHVIDFGCGLSYLTFALHYLLTEIHHRDVQLIGIDQNEHVIGRCRDIARRCSLDGIQFSAKKIDAGGEHSDVDLAVSLHACDTATDNALAFAVSAGARVILAAPCCQHELSTKIDSPELAPLLRQGILKERFAALATDTLRSCALEASGYRTQVLEFIESEHTPKNLLLRGVLRPAGEDRDQKSIRAAEEYVRVKQMWGVESLATDQVLTSSLHPKTD